MSNVAIVQEGLIPEDPSSTLKLVTLPIPKAAPGEVVVHISMRHIHIYDFFILSQGVHNGTPGCEGFGIVHEVGEGVTKFHKGQRVYPHTSATAWAGNGSWQQYILLAAELVWPVPDAMSDEQATQFVINPWTSYSLLKQLQPVPPGEFVVQTAAGSSVGKQLSSLAKHWSAQMINIVRRPEQKAELLALGDHHQVICSSEEDVVARVKAITSGRGAWAALDAVSGTMTQTLGSSLRDGGRIIVYGFLGGTVSSVNVMDLLRGVSLTGFNLGSVIKEFESREACAAEVAPLVIDGILPVADVEKFELTDFKRALARAKEPGHSSHVLLVN